MKRLFFLFLLFPAWLPAQEVYTLEQAQQDALDRSYDIRIAALSVAEAEDARAAASGRRLPRLDLSAGYTHVSETGGIDIQLPGLPARSIQFGDGNIWETAVTASVPLFSGFRLSAQNDIAAQQVDIAEEALAGTRTGIRHRVALVYRRGQLAMRSMRIYDEQLAYLAQQLSTLRALLGQGQVLPYDTLLLSTRISALRVEHRAARTAHDNAIEDLRELTRSERDVITLSTEITVDEGPLRLQGAASLHETAERKRSDLRILAQRQELGRLRIRAEESAMYPSVSAFASYRYGKPGVDQVANTWMDYYTAGVSLQWNLWSWGSDRAEIQQQVRGVQKAEEEYSRLRDAVRADINRVLNEIAVLEDTRGMLEEQIRQERTKQALLQARFGEGLATATEVVDAETALTTARLRREQADIQYAMKLTELAAAIGWND